MKATRIWTEEEIKNFILTRDDQLYKALLRLYERQTEDERTVRATNHQNGIGFNGIDAPILSSFAEFLKKTGFLTPKQKQICRRKIVKYNRQLVEIANGA